MSRVHMVFFLLLLKHVNSAPQTVLNTNAITVTLRPPAITVTLRPPAITVTLQPPLPIATIPPREAKPLPFYSTTQRHFAEPLPFYSTTQRHFAKPLPFYSTTQRHFAKPLPFYSTTQKPFAKPLPFYSTSASFIFHDDHNSLQNRGRRSTQSEPSNGINTAKINNEQTANTAVPTPVAFRAVSRVAATESFRDIVQVF